MTLDHATIVTHEVEAMRHFFTAVAGLKDGPRPAFGVNGNWLYADDRPVIHLIEGSVPARAGSASPRIDHVALRVEGTEAWRALLERMRHGHVPYEQAQVPSTGELQLFVSLAPGVVIEFVTRPALVSAAFSNECA